ncbi:hypothetical protein DSD19_01750 [Rhodovulum sp. BSW8]|uniref:Uncharacterized protein n=1 Tax=Rhodovulum visakhapatnamense TaxID=364297 RepID=A0A4R8G5F4_9RHOB|nr:MULTISPECIES: hypothetical protein [Rhodovulum]RBO54868.1 hypothetical protein DSD19_01750 [Rhodovulum sp. BSW8]TDX33673.1 hypothetical protein EV657_101101 [Rhodovulum visakhapatnamense]
MGSALDPTMPPTREPWAAAIRTDLDLALDGSDPGYPVGGTLEVHVAQLAAAAVALSDVAA